MDMLNPRWHRPCEEPETDGESWAGCDKRTNFRLRTKGTMLLTVAREYPLVIDSRKNVDQQTDEKGYEREGRCR